MLLMYEIYIGQIPTTSPSASDATGYPTTATPTIDCSIFVNPPSACDPTPSPTAPTAVSYPTAPTTLSGTTSDTAGETSDAFRMNYKLYCLCTIMIMHQLLF